MGTPIYGNSQMNEMEIATFGVNSERTWSNLHLWHKLQEWIRRNAIVRRVA